jgi:hypothetical protein
MGIWATAEGTISHHVSDHFSIKKHIEEKWKGEEYSVSSNLISRGVDIISESVFIAWDSEGINAAIEFNKLLDSISQQYKTVRVDLEAHIRFFK